MIVTLQLPNPLNPQPKIHDEDLGILTRTNDASLIRFRAKNPACVPSREVQQQIPRLHIKDLDILIIASRDQSPTDRIDVERSHQVIVSADFLQALPGIGVPDSNHLVVSGRGDESGIVGELTAGKPFGVASELADVFAGVNIPELDLKISAAADDGVSS